MKTRMPIAVVCSDIHLSHNPPIFRSQEPDWYEAMARGLREVIGLANAKRVPLIIAGDIFDRWQSPPQLISFAIAHFREVEYGVYAVPGQHDLPNHQYGDIHRSAYWTLVEAGLKNIEPGQPTHVQGMALWGFPWDEAIKSRGEMAEKSDEVVDIAVCHSYIWKGASSSYPGAPEEKKLGRYAGKLAGYHAAFFGDNHKGFDAIVNDRLVMNCGTLFIRKADEVGYRPRVGVLLDDTESVFLQLHYLDTTKDVYAPQVPGVESVAERTSASFLQELQELGSDSLDFRDCVLRMLDDEADEEVRKVVLESLEGVS